MFKGSFPALITPFKNGAVDEKSFQAFVEWQIAEGSNGLVPCGTTGETPTLSHDEHMRVTELCIEVTNGRVPIIAGTGSNSTDEAIHLTQHAQKAGANAALIAMPYYNKPTQKGLYLHYKAIHDNSDIPIFIYNVPGRSVVDMSVATMAKLAKLPRIAGVKDATGDLTRPVATRRECGTDFCQLTGEDGISLPFLAVGGVGCISVTANIAPKMCSEMQSAWRAGDITKASALHDRLAPVHDAMFCETNPGPVKYAAELLGICSSEMRLPMCEIADTSKEQVRAALKGAGLLG